MSGEPKQKIFFDEFELDAAHRRLLRRGGEEIRLNPKAFDVLVFLAENAGQTISKDEILSAVWDGQFVEEANLAVQISTLRRVLKETRDAPRFLVTVPGKGYKFIADVQTEEEIVIEKHSFSRLVIEQEGEKGRRGEKSRKTKNLFFAFSPFRLF